jgi:hypothetical protein
MRVKVVVSTLCIQILFVLCGSEVWAGCINPPLPDASITQFKQHPEALVAPDMDSRTIEAQVRDLAGTDASLAADLVHLATGATPRSRNAIAAGLAQAAAACATIDQQAALLIQEAVAGYDDGQFQEVFAAVAGDLSTAATYAALASAGGAVGSVEVTNPTGAGTSNSQPGVSVALVFSTPGIALLANNSTNDATVKNDTTVPPSSGATTAANSVSSTR